MKLFSLLFLLLFVEIANSQNTFNYLGTIILNDYTPMSFQLHLMEKDGIVNFEISNDVDPQKRKDSVSGVGLENIKKRLPYLYRGFWMDVMQDEGKYKVKVRINLGKKVKL